MHGIQGGDLLSSTARGILGRGIDGRAEINWLDLLAHHQFRKVMAMAARLLLFGGTFDPIHVGHVSIARQAHEQLLTDRTIFIPAAVSPFKISKRSADANHRVDMVKLAVRNEPNFVTDDCELRRSPPSYTLDTLRHFRESYGNETALFWLVGRDALADLHRWYRIGELVKICTIVTVDRRGVSDHDAIVLLDVIGREAMEAIEQHQLHIDPIDVSSSMIRDRLARGESIDGLVAPTVATYIYQHGLYGTSGR